MGIVSSEGLAPTPWGMPNASGVYFREEKRRRTHIYTDENLSPPYDLVACQMAPGKLHSTAPLGFCKGEDLGPRRVGKSAICLVLLRTSLLSHRHTVTSPNFPLENCDQHTLILLAISLPLSTEIFGNIFPQHILKRDVKDIHNGGTNDWWKFSSAWEPWYSLGEWLSLKGKREWLGVFPANEYGFIVYDCVKKVKYF